MTLGDIVTAGTGLDSTGVENRMTQLGPNYIRIKKPKISTTIVREFSGAFYLYQCFIVWAWFPLWYYYMAIVYTIIVVIGGLSVAFFKYKNEVSLYKLTHISGHVEVLRDGQYNVIDQKDLVPGDIVRLKHGLAFADMIVLRCNNVVVDESALTGESTPVSKTGVNTLDKDVLYNPKSHKRQTISAVRMRPV
jgi:P-type E1-E2 ATPase